MHIARFVSFAVLVGCAASSEDISGDPLGMPADKADSWWEPKRDLEIVGSPITVARGDAGHVVRGRFDSNAYAGTIIDTVGEIRLSRFTRSWLSEDNLQPWHTEPFIFQWRGIDGADLTDWANWSLLSHCCNNGDVTLPRAGRYLLVVMTTDQAYANRTPYVAYVRHSTEYVAPVARVHGTLRCGPKRRPVAGSLMSINNLPEHVRTAADGTFAFATTVPVGRIDLYSDVDSLERIGLFDAVLTPDDGALDLVLTECR